MESLLTACHDLGGLFVISVSFVLNHQFSHYSYGNVLHSCDTFMREILFNSKWHETFKMVIERKLCENSLVIRQSLMEKLTEHYGFELIESFDLSEKLLVACCRQQ